MNRVIAAVFPNYEAAEQAISRLRLEGVPDEAISVITQHAPESERKDNVKQVSADNKGTGAVKGIGIGAGVGALFGLAAIFIPGVGPFITAGALATTLGTVGGAAASGAIVGGTAGGIVGLLENYGLSSEDAKRFSGDLEKGSVFVGVAATGTIDAGGVRQIMAENGGRTSAYVA
jgi:uncharacterized membrane protein